MLVHIRHYKLVVSSAHASPKFDYAIGCRAHYASDSGTARVRDQVKPSKKIDRITTLPRHNTV